MENGGKVTTLPSQAPNMGRRSENMVQRHLGEMKMVGAHVIEKINSMRQQLDTLEQVLQSDVQLATEACQRVVESADIVHQVVEAHADTVTRLQSTRARMVAVKL